MYVADQSSTSRRRSGIFDKETTPGEFTLNPDPIKIYRRSGVFEPNPSQQGLKHNESQFFVLRAWFLPAQS